ncbi:MAG: hypothetical protein IV097_18050 [Burkholderiaceae bacterium]|nr:hypothetical protein [Burkholderiaceae bacterium]
MLPAPFVTELFPELGYEAAWFSFKPSASDTPVPPESRCNAVAQVQPPAAPSPATH